MLASCSLSLCVCMTVWWQWWVWVRIHSKEPRWIQCLRLCIAPPCLEFLCSAQAVCCFACRPLLRYKKIHVYIYIIRRRRVVGAQNSRGLRELLRCCAQISLKLTGKLYGLSRTVKTFFFSFFFWIRNFFICAVNRSRSRISTLDIYCAL